MGRFKGKVAVVSGASSGIGLGIAKALVREDMIVFGLSRRKEKMLNEMTEFAGKGLGTFHALECDVTDPKSVENAFRQIKKMSQQLHVLVNNAGILKFKTIEGSTIEDLEQINNVNFMGVVYVYKQALNLLKATEDAIIININSIMGNKILPPGNLPVPLNIYPATKFALRALSETMSSELFDTKIRVTNLSPGYVSTEMTANATTEEAKILPALKPEHIADSILFIIGLPADVHIPQLTIKPRGEKF